MTNKLVKTWDEVSIPEMPDSKASTRPLPDIVCASEFLAALLPTPDELVEGMIHKGTQTMLAGGSKSFKTWTLLDLALSVSTGTEWWGRKTCQGRVLYLNLEIDPPFFQKRIMEIATAKELEGPYRNFDIWNLRGHVADITVLLPEIVRRCKGEGYGLIIPDPIYKILGSRNENAAGEIAEFLNCLDEIAVETEAALVYGHHLSKGSAAGKDQLDRASGSGVFARYADGIVTLTRHEEDNAFTVEATLRNFKPVTPFVVRWEHPLMLRDETLDPAKLKRKPGRPKKHTSQSVLAFLKDGMTKAEWKAAATKDGVPTTTFYDFAKKAEGHTVESYPDGKVTRLRKKITLDLRPHGAN